MFYIAQMELSGFGIARCSQLKERDNSAINGERSVPARNVPINERLAFQGVRKMRFHCDRGGRVVGINACAIDNSQYVTSTHRMLAF